MPITTTVSLDLDGSGSFATPISAYLLEATVRQGRTKSLDPMEPATATVKLNNADGRFSPDNAGGPYGSDFDDNGVGIRIEAGTRRFTGYIVEIQQDPFIENQEVVLTCTDRLGLLARQNISCGLFRQQPLYLILNRVLDILEAGEEITNPGAAEGSTTGYSAAASGTTISAIAITSFEGDWCIEAVCDGTVSGQGIRYDVGAVAALQKCPALFARLAAGDGSATLTIRGLDASLAQVWTTTINVTDGAWAYKKYYSAFCFGHRYIEIITQAAVALTILVDDLHQVPIFNIIARSIPTTLDAQVELFGLYEAPALENLNKLLATEAAGFLYMRTFGTLYGTIYASAQVVRDGKTVPSATFGDDGTNVPYVGLAYGLDARERISRVEVRSQGTYEAMDEEATIWQLSPTGFLVPATESIVIHAQYSQPARRCALVVEPPPTTFAIAQEADDAALWKIGTGTPTEITSLRMGMIPSGSPYRFRSYLRFDTSTIPDAATLTKVTLKLWLKANLTTVDFWIMVRDAPAWSPIDATDWTLGDGNPTLGTYLTTYLPPVGQPFEIDIDVSGIDLTGWTEFRLASNRDELGYTPTYDEWIMVYCYGDDPDKRPTLLVEYSEAGFAAVALENYGVGGKITLTASAVEQAVPNVSITGYPFQACSEESVVVADAITPPVIPATLSVEMPCQGTRTPDMVAEAARLALRHSGKVRRLPLSLQEQDAASLTQMQTRELDDLITVINEAFPFSTKINDNFFVEGLAWVVRDQGKVLEVIYNLEEA